MRVMSVKKEINSLLTKLPVEKQRQALEFMRNLSGAKLGGVPGSVLLKFAGCIQEDDLRRMEAAIEKGCEQVDPDGW